MQRVLEGCSLFVGLGCVVTLVVSLLVSGQNGYDQEWLLYAAERVLAGVKLYGPQLIEVNPPLVVWFSTLPVMLSNLVHINVLLMLRLLVLSMIAGNIAWIGHLLRRLRPDMALVVRILLLCSVAVVELWIEPGNFGQREHLLVILLLPYILAAALNARRSLSRTEYIALGFVAGLAVCFKPQQVLVVVFLELALALRNRSLRRAISPEFLTLLLTGCGYIGLIFFVSPIYFKQIVPVLLNTYWAFGAYSAGWLAIHNHVKLDILLPVVFLVSLLYRKLRISTVPLVLAVCSYGALFAFLVQHTGWAYQRYPNAAFLELAAFWLLIEAVPSSIAAISDRRTASVITAIAACFVVLLPIGLVARQVRGYSSAPAEENAVQKELNRLPPKTAVYVFSTSISAFSDVFERHLIWGSRFAHLSMIPAIIQNQLGPTSASTPFKHLSPETVASLAATQRADTA
ncbi:MAG: hypothetical protein ABI197_09280, partial [Granulicella sp.]